MILPKFSIITPSLNQAAFLESNIQSVLAQHYPNFEHIIIDGGSTDGTIEIFKKYPHLKWTSETDNGQTQALNKGFKKATGEVIGWLNADDIYCSPIFASVAERFNDNAVMVVFGDGIEIDSRGEKIRSVVSRGIFPEDLIKYWKWRYEFFQPAFFFRRKIFDEVGYLDENLYYAMDFDLLIRLSRRYKFHYIPVQLACFRLHKKSKTGMTNRSVIPKYVWEMHRVSKRYWGKPVQWSYYSYLFSFIGAVMFSLIKNVLFIPNSKSRTLMKRIFNMTLNAVVTTLHLEVIL
jgi:glycosyltransferase involved in cell wall biosynthesis